MTVIIVAPSIPDLPLVAEEAAAVANALPKRILLQGEEASARGIINAVADAMSSGRIISGIWFASHGDDNGVWLSSGALDAISLASILSTSGAQWVVFNTCGSRGLVSAIQLRAEVDVVATEAESIADPHAWEFGRLLAIQYAQSGDLRQSVAQVARGSDRHRYYENNRRPMERIKPESLSTEEKLNLLVGRIVGDRLRGVVGLVDTVTETNQAIAALTVAMREERQRREELAETVKSNQNEANGKFATLTMWIWLTLAGLGLVGAVLIAIIVTRI